MRKFRLKNPVKNKKEMWSEWIDVEGEIFTKYSLPEILERMSLSSLRSVKWAAAPRDPLNKMAPYFDAGRITCLAENWGMVNVSLNAIYYVFKLKKEGTFHFMDKEVFEDIYQEVKSWGDGE